jgi:hypothetical protein
MPTLSDIVYYIILLIAVVMSFKARQSNIPGLYILRLLLCIAFTNEMITQLLRILNLNDNLPNYFYIPLEYVLLVVFYRKNTKNKLFQKIMALSIVIYIFSIVAPMIFYSGFEKFPSGIYNISCGFNILWISILFFNLQTLERLSMTSIPMFWILTSFLTFYSGIFFFNSVYNYFIDHDNGLARILRTYINTSLNNLLYLLLIYAFVCSWKLKKYSYQ